MTQLSLDFSQRLAEQAIGRVRRAAERERPGFTDDAADFIAGYLRRRAEPLPGELLVDVAQQAGFVPRDARAFGPVFQLLTRQRRIRQCGWCDRRKGHGSGGGRMWEAV